MARNMIGLIVGLRDTIDESMAGLREIDIPSCQLSCWDPAMHTAEMRKKLLAAMREHKITVTALWAGYTGVRVWDFIEGPATIGLVPPATRRQRAMELKQGAKFAASCGIKAIATHAGFIPEDPKDPNYGGTVKALRQVAKYSEKMGVELWFETGQETPVALLRTIQDIGTDNLGVNLDPANLILYGKANPVDALDVFGKYVRGVHAKDGLYPTDGRSLGKETPLGKGKVNFAVLVPKLLKLGFKGAFTIEREISGPRQKRDIIRARDILTGLLAGV